MDLVTLALAKKYTEDSLTGAGALKGEKGDPGPVGPTGPQGEKGPQGEQGVPGQDGLNVLKPATTDTLGGIKVGENLNIDESGILNVIKGDAPSVNGYTIVEGTTPPSGAKPNTITFIRA